MCTERFLTIRKQECLEHSLKVVKLIVEEEKHQLEELKQEIQKSSEELEKFKEQEAFEQHNEVIRKEVEKVKRFDKGLKQRKYNRDRKDFEEGTAFVVSQQRGRSKSRQKQRNFKEISSDLSGGETEWSDEMENRGMGSQSVTFFGKRKRRRGKRIRDRYGGEESERSKELTEKTRAK